MDEFKFDFCRAIISVSLTAYFQSFRKFAAPFRSALANNKIFGRRHPSTKGLCCEFVGRTSFGLHN